MKLHITENVDKIIDNYYMVPIVYGKINVDSIPNNCAEEILIDNIGQVKLENLLEFLAMVMSKLRLNGLLILSGIDLETICQKVTQGYLSSEDFNNVLAENRGFYNLQDIVKHIKNFKLHIESIKFGGEFYEIRAIRPNQN